MALASPSCAEPPQGLGADAQARSTPNGLAEESSTEDQTEYIAWAHLLRRKHAGATRALLDVEDFGLGCACVLPDLAL